MVTEEVSARSYALVTAAYNRRELHHKSAGVGYCSEGKAGQMDNCERRVERPD